MRFFCFKLESLDLSSFDSSNLIDVNIFPIPMCAVSHLKWSYSRTGALGEEPGFREGEYLNRVWNLDYSFGIMI